MNEEIKNTVLEIIMLEVDVIILVFINSKEYISKLELHLFIFLLAEDIYK